MKFNNQRKMNLGGDKGFTLVELLIVIVVIGVLSAMMMLSSVEAVTSAEAIRIINNLRNWKTATLEYYMDNLDNVRASDGYVKDDNGEYKYFREVVKAKDILPYLGSSGLTVNEANGSVTDDAGGIYNTLSDNNKKYWAIVYTLPPLYQDDNSLLTKLEARAEATGLRLGDGTYSKLADGPFKRKDNKPTNSYWIAMVVIDFAK